MHKAKNVMTVEEARERFAGKWLAMEVVTRDSAGEPEGVRVVQQARSLVELEDGVGPGGDLYVSFAGPVVPEGWGFLFHDAVSTL